MRSVYLIVLLAIHGVHHASATFNFPSFDGAQPLMSALGSMQQYLFGGGGGPGRVVKSAASEPAFATATVGYGTILKNPTPMVKGSPYGPPRAPLRRPSRPFPRPPSNKYPPFKGGYYPKFKPLGSYEKVKPAVVEYKQPSGGKEHHPAPHKQFQPYDYTRSQHSVHNSYTEAPEEATKSNAEIVQQSFRPPIHFYQQPHVATSHQVSNLNVKASAAHHHHYQQQQQQHHQQPQQQHQQPHHRSDNVVDFSRPDPVFTAATMGSDWKPISSPVSRVTVSERRSDPLMHKQVEPPPTIKRQYEVHSMQKQHIVDRSGHGFVDDDPSEEVVSAVVFVKKTNDD
ncbi:uncharacterized protein LOC135946174 [Cloeon dipterum]|uniref:uncharacterized protein LOC135946174 n=1 Tax=Cloeon dipterum TaxID=197152 RepID=UPI0032202288